MGNNHAVNTTTTSKTDTNISVDDTPLTESDLVPVVRAIVEVTDWYSLGVALGIPDHQIKIDGRQLGTIQMAGHDLQNCLVFLMRRWFSTRSASWSSLVEALKLLNRMDIAQQIIKDHPNNHNHAVNTMTTLRTATSLVDDTPLTGSDLFPVLESIVDVTDWYVLGCALGIPHFELESIQRDGRNEADRQRKMILKWLFTGRASWSSLVEALKSPSINRMKIAEQIIKDHSNNSNHAVNTMTTLRTATSLVDDTPLTESDLVPLLESIIEVTDCESDCVPVLTATDECFDWYSLGLTLGLPYYLLETIRRDDYRQTNYCKLKVILNWLDTGSASWSSLVEALKSPLLVHRRSAQQIMKDHPNNSVLESALTKAMEEGGGKLNPCTITLHGPPGVGKTSLKRVILGQPPLPKEKQNSTNIMENPARAISTNRLTAAGGQLLMEVNNMEFIKMLAKNVESLRRQEPPQHDPIPEPTPRPTPPPTPQPVPPPTPSTPQPIPPHTSGTPQPMLPFTSSEAIESIKEQLVLNVKPSTELFDDDWIHLIDSGGQPQFLDVLPLLYRNESLHIVVTRLDIGLDDKPNFCYTVKGENVAPPGNLRLSNREFIERACQVAEAQATSGKSVPKVMVVGTHKDKLGSNGEARLKEINKELTKIHRKYNRVLIRKSTDEVIFAMNTMAPVGEERKQYTEDLQKCILQEARKTGDRIDVPLKWLVFHLDLEKKGSIIRKSECYKTGEMLGMGRSDVENALKYFNKVGLLLYYPDDVPDLIFTKMGPLIGRLSRLITASFIIPGCSVTADYDRLREKGLFNKSFLHTLFEDLYNSEEEFHDDDFLKLLECLKIAVLVGDDDYFLPSALSLNNPSGDSLSISCVPFVFSWDEQFLPHGFFLTLVVELLRKKDSVYFELRKDVIQCRLEIQFTVAKRRIPGVVKLVDRKRWVEVCYSGILSKCYQLKEVIDVAVLKVLKVFEHTDLQFPMPGFLCNLCDITDPHCCFLSPDEPIVSCSKDDSKYGAVTPDMSCWIDSKGSKGKGYSSILKKSPEPVDVWDLINSKSSEWNEIGIQLRVPSDTRNSFSRDIRLSDQGRLEKVLQTWKEEQTSEVTWEHILASLVSMGFVDMAGEVQRHLSQEDVIKKYEKTPDYEPFNSS